MTMEVEDDLQGEEEAGGEDRSLHSFVLPGEGPTLAGLLTDRLNRRSAPAPAPAPARRRRGRGEEPPPGPGPLEALPGGRARRSARPSALGPPAPGVGGG